MVLTSTEVSRPVPDYVTNNVQKTEEKGFFFLNQRIFLMFSKCNTIESMFIYVQKTISPCSEGTFTSNEFAAGGGERDCCYWSGISM